MKKTLICILFIGSVVTVFAQKQKLIKFDKIEITKYLKQKKYADAKEYIDKVFQNPKEQNDNEALAYKAGIYAQVGYDSAAKCPTCIAVAANILDSLQKAMTDTAQFNKLMRGDYGINAISIVYATDFNIAKNNYFANGLWDSAYHSFYKSAHWVNYVTLNGFSQNPDRNAIDTLTVLYTGFSAQNASGFNPDSGFQNPAMADSAVMIYKALAERNIATPDGYPMYVFLVQYYQYKKDTANANKYLTMGKQLYPAKAGMWLQLQNHYQKTVFGGKVFNYQYINIFTKEADLLSAAMKTKEAIGMIYVGKNDKTQTVLVMGKRYNIGCRHFGETPDNETLFINDNKSV